MILFCSRCGAELPAKFRGEWFDTAPPCSECGVALVEPVAGLAPSDAEVTYGLDEWPVVDRAALTGALVDDDIPYRWEAGVVLAVPETVEEVVDGMLDDLEGRTSDGDAPAEPDATTDAPAEAEADEDDEDDDADGGEEAQAAMSDLFVAADRLHHAPWDLELRAELDTLAATVGASLPPYGVDRSVWKRVHELAEAAGEADDEDASTEASAALRDFLRPLV